MTKPRLRVFDVLLTALPVAGQQEKIVHVDLTCQAPGSASRPSFSPYGTPVKLADVPADALQKRGAHTEPRPQGSDAFDASILAGT